MLRHPPGEWYTDLKIIDHKKSHASKRLQDQSNDEPRILRVDWFFWSVVMAIAVVVLIVHGEPPRKYED